MIYVHLFNSHKAIKLKAQNATFNLYITVRLDVLTSIDYSIVSRSCIALGVIYQMFQIIIHFTLIYNVIK